MGINNMNTMKITNHQIAVVRDNTGNIIHTHEVICYDNADPIDEKTLHNEALQSAATTHPNRTNLTAHQISNDELKKLKKLQANRNNPKQTAR
jgi:hypothetical protein